MSSSSTPERRAGLRWGVRLAAALSAGCAPPPVADSSYGESGLPPDPPQNGAAAIDVAAIKAHEARLQEAPEGAMYRSWSYRIETGQGEIFYTRAWHVNGSISQCPFGSPLGACGVMTVRPRQGEERAMLPAPQDWVTLVGGRDGAYGLRTRGHALDRIDPQGQVSLLLDDPVLEYWRSLWVVELATRRVLLGSAHGPLLMVDIGLRQGVSRPVDLPMSLAYSAQDARRAGNMKMRALYGPPHPRVLSGDDWAMVWVEALAPPFDQPRGKPWRSGAKHGCGSSRPPSRPLSDPSVEKRVVISRFAGTERQGEEIALTLNDLDLSRQHLDIRVEGGRVRVSVAAGLATE